MAGGLKPPIPSGSPMKLLLSMFSGMMFAIRLPFVHKMASRIAADDRLPAFRGITALGDGVVNKAEFVGFGDAVRNIDRTGLISSCAIFCKRTPGKPAGMRGTQIL